MDIHINPALRVGHESIKMGGIGIFRIRNNFEIGEDYHDKTDKNSPNDGKQYDLKHFPNN
jgi:hypothetical protein